MLKKTLQCLEGIHLSQSGSLLMLYVDKLINTPFRVLARMVDTLACRRVEMLLAETLQVRGWDSNAANILCVDMKAHTFASGLELFKIGSPGNPALGPFSIVFEGKY